MNFYKWLTVIGGVLLVCGLFTAFISSKYTSSVVGEAQKGVAVLAPDLGSRNGKKRNVYFGGLTSGFILGWLLPPSGSCSRRWGLFCCYQDLKPNRNQGPGDARAL
jgi:hypothetical protein